MRNLTLRERRPADLAVEWRWTQAEADPEWTLWDGPYFHASKKPSHLTLEEYTQRASAQPPSPNRRVIALDDACIGLVTRHEEEPEEGGWWELGIVIYDPAHWGGGLGTRALTLWTAATFAQTAAHVLTLTTWSVSERMIQAAGKVGYQECARIPEAREWAGQRWDSVKLALLRSSWPEPVSPPF